MLETFLKHEEELVTKELILFMKSIIENNSIPNNCRAFR